MKRNKAYRIHQSKRVQKRRAKDYRWFKDLESHKSYNLLKKNHFGCGCSGCKPWKHGLESKYKPSELRRFYKIED